MEMLALAGLGSRDMAGPFPPFAPASNLAAEGIRSNELLHAQETSAWEVKAVTSKRQNAMPMTPILKDLFNT
jgi:hypothetical protein